MEAFVRTASDVLQRKAKEREAEASDVEWKENH